MESFLKHISKSNSKRIKIKWNTPPIKWQEVTVKFGPDNKYKEKKLVSVPPRFVISKVETYPYKEMISVLYDKKDKQQYQEANLRDAKTTAREIMHREYEWQMKKAKPVAEGVEHGDIPRPKKEYYTRPFNISGKIVELYPVYGVPVKSMKNFNAPKTVRVNGKDYTPSSSKDSPYWKDSAKVWRWRVRIQTTEGWMLMGYIGSVKAKEELPKIILGDTAFIENLTLSLVVGGVRTQYDRNANKEVDVPMDYRANRYDRQLHGKVKRQSL
jgi:hypothetical protein